MKTIEHDTFTRLARSREFLAENHETRITLAGAADIAFLSPFHYHRMFTRAFGQTPQEFLTRVRLERAKTLLRTSGMSVSEICLEVGYESLGTFSAKFHKIEGVSPTEFRRVFSMPELWALKVIPNCMMGFR